MTTALGSYLEAQSRLAYPDADPELIAELATKTAHLAALRREMAMMTDLLGRKQDEIARLRHEAIVKRATFDFDIPLTSDRCR